MTETVLVCKADGTQQLVEREIPAEDTQKLEAAQSRAGDGAEEGKKE